MEPNSSVRGPLFLHFIKDWDSQKAGYSALYQSAWIQLLCTFDAFSNFAICEFFTENLPKRRNCTRLWPVGICARKLHRRPSRAGLKCLKQRCSVNSDWLKCFYFLMDGKRRHCDILMNGKLRHWYLMDGNDFEQAFCFLENVRDPLNPKSGCYSDTQWSEKDARWPKNI